MPLFVGYEPQNDNDKNNFLDIYTNGTNKQLQITNYDYALRRIAWTSESKELAQLKPILRLILKCMVYVFLIDECLVKAYNLLFGGLFIHRMLHCCKEFARADQSRSFALWCNLCTYALALLLRLISLWVYDREAINAMLHPQNTLSVALKIVAESLYFMMYFVALSVYSIWFGYCMLMVTATIEQLQKDVMQCKYNFN